MSTRVDTLWGRPFPGALVRLDGQSEADLVRAAQRGDRDAFAALYEKHVTSVFRYVRSRVYNNADAEDLTAEVFMRAMKALPSYREQGTPFVAWLVRIAHNTTVNHLRKQNVRAEVDLPAHVLSDDDPEQQALFRIQADNVKHAMAFLTDLQREVLSLRFGADLSIAETAKAMKRSEDAVKFLQHSAVKALRRLLARDAGEVGS